MVPLQQPLTRRRVASGAQLIYWFLPGVSLWVGLTYMFGPRHAFDTTPSYHYIVDWMPVAHWGWFFVGFGVLELACTFERSRRSMVLALCIASFSYLAWSAMFLAAAIEVPDALLTQAGIWGFIGVAHLALATSLARDVVMRYGR